MLKWWWILAFLVFATIAVTIPLILTRDKASARMEPKPDSSQTNEVPEPLKEQAAS